MYDAKLAAKAADTIRIISAEAIQKVKSGHPGMPMGCADYAFTLWDKYLRFNPENPRWIGRDRFVLSAGHGSMLLYSLLHLFNCGLDIEELKSFRHNRLFFDKLHLFFSTPCVILSYNHILPLIKDNTTVVNLPVRSAKKMKDNDYVRRKTCRKSS